jgi:hypothetical protein
MFNVVHSVLRTFLAITFVRSMLKPIRIEYYGRNVTKFSLLNVPFASFATGTVQNTAI